MEEQSDKYLFESMPVPKAVATLAVPTIISQVVTMIYNLADTFFVGQIGNPAMVAAVSLVSPWFNLLTALGNLFGLGGSSLISRMLGAKKHGNIKHVAAFSVWGGAAVTLVFSLGTFLARGPLLRFLGASPDTYGYAESYLFWVVVMGGIPTMVSLTLGHLLRSEGHAREASAGMMFGGILNVVPDPAQCEQAVLDYLDLYLIHQPMGDYIGAYRAMEEAYEEGILRAVGVCNFYPARLADFCETVDVMPAVNQVELHPFFQQEDALALMKEYGVHPEAWGPFAEGKHGIFTHPVLTKIGEKYGKSAAQTALLWNVQRGVTVIPKSVHKDRMEQNLDIWDFSLSSEDMAEIAKLDIGHSEIVDHSDPALAKMLHSRKIHD